jgi:aspartate/methionine/tyrosine aminotransferase
VIDETYKDFRDASGPPHDLFQRRDWADTFVQLFSFSKTYAMTGYRVGSIIASERFVAEAEKIMDCMAICAPHISQQAALFGLTKLKGWKDEKRRMMAERTAALREAFKTPALKYGLDSVGAYFAYVRHPFENENAKTVARRLAEDHDLLCLPGSMFGSGQERHLRIAFAALDAEYMPMVVERLIESQG